ncbi:unnamed protein product, partial [Prorocentrum cordatum]
WTRLGEWGGPRACPLEAPSIASLARSATSTLPECGRLYGWLVKLTDMLETPSTDDRRLTVLPPGRRYPGHWTSRVSNMFVMALLLARAALRASLLPVPAEKWRRSPSALRNLPA